MITRTIEISSVVSMCLTEARTVTVRSIITDTRMAGEMDDCK